MVANYIFEFRANSVAMWEEKALSLKAASEKIYASLVEISGTIEQGVNTGENADETSYFLASGLSSIWMLSSGFAVESLIKALIILLAVSSSTAIIIEEGEKKRLNVKGLFGDDSHNLNKLLKKVTPIYRPEFTDEESLFMFRMTTYTKWRGKYPVPLSAMELTLPGQGIEQKLIKKIMNHSVRYPEPVEVKDDRDKRAFDNVFGRILNKLSETKRIMGDVSASP